MARSWQLAKEETAICLSYPSAPNSYIVTIGCRSAMQDGEFLVYKVTEHPDTIESRLLHLEQYFPGVEVGARAKFTRFTDTLMYGNPYIYKENNRFSFSTYYSGSGGCGKYYLFDVSGDCPKMLEFREKSNCEYSTSCPPPQKWKLFPAKQRAKWPVAPSPYRKGWKDPNACTQ